MQGMIGGSCRRLSRWLLLLTALAFAAPAPADAQSGYPNRPVRILVPYGPGGVADTTARLLAQKLNERLRQPFVIENRPGAGGILASQAGATAPPDGYTLTLDRQRHGDQQVAVQVAALRRAPRLHLGLGHGLARSHDRDQGGWSAQDREGYRRGGEEKPRQAEFRHHRARQHAASVGGAVHADGRHQGHDGDVPHHARSGDSASARRRRCRLRLSGRLPRAVERASSFAPSLRPARSVRPRLRMCPPCRRAACRITW